MNLNIHRKHHCQLSSINANSTASFSYIGSYNAWDPHGYFFLYLAEFTTRHMDLRVLTSSHMKFNHLTVCGSFPLWLRYFFAVAVRLNKLKLRINTLRCIDIKNTLCLWTSYKKLSRKSRISLQWSVLYQGLTV